MMVPVRARTIFALSILAGLCAGGLLAALNLVVVWPSFTLIADSVLDELIADGQYDELEFDSRLNSAYMYLTWGSAAIGIAGGALIGGTRVMSGSGGIPTRYIVDAMTIAGVAWFVLYVVPSVKYPSSPIAMFDGQAEATYYSLYFGYLSISGLAALGIVLGFRKLTAKNKIFGMAALYLTIIAVAFFLFPDYEQDSTYDQTLLNSWRASISASLTTFWLVAGLISGLLWKYGVPSTRT